MKKTNTDKDWDPILKGATYCSRGCGRGCSVEEYTRATNNANEALRHLPPGWTKEVHENLGWWSYVVSPCGLITVSCKNYSPRDYSAQIGTTNFTGRSKSIRNAILLAIEQATLNYESETKRMMEAMSNMREISRLIKASALLVGM